MPPHPTGANPQDYRRAGEGRGFSHVSACSASSYAQVRWTQKSNPCSRLLARAAFIFKRPRRMPLVFDAEVHEH